MWEVANGYKLDKNLRSDDNTEEISFSIKYHVQKKCIETVGKAKYLGLTSSSKRNWETQLDTTCAKAFK